MRRMTRHQATSQRLEASWSRSGRTATAAPAYHGGLVMRRRRWTGPASISAGQAYSDYDVAYNGSDPLIHQAAHVPWVLMESRDIGSGGADLGSALDGRCSECDATSIICRCPHYYTAPARTS